MYRFSLLTKRIPTKVQVKLTKHEKRQSKKNNLGKDME